MKAKTLLIAAATLAVGAITSQAQVYSQNIVGYVNVTLTNGFNLVANQLDLDGTGTNNTVYTTVGTNLPTSSKIYAYDPTLPGYRYITLNANYTWTAGTSGGFVKNNLQPGGSVFVYVPGTGVTTNITFVGTVLQQTNATTYPAQYQMVAYPFPEAGYLTTNFNYVANAPTGTPTTYDKVLTWNPTTQLFTTHTKLAGSWQGGSPNLGVAQGFFLVPNQTTTWTNGFNVGP
jgi:hypothetical protein